MSSVFISYAHDDSHTADEIAELLDALSIPYFRDVQNLAVGDAITPSVQEALQNAAAIITILSPGSAKSQWVAYEVGFATGRNKRILPYLTHPAMDRPGFMADLVYADSMEKLKRFFETNPDWGTVSPAEIGGHQAESLSDFEVEYLKNISLPHNNGKILSIADFDEGREAARYQAAIERFCKLGLMLQKANVYLLTNKGWEYADNLWMLEIASKLSTESFTPLDTVLEGLKWDQSRESEIELRRLLDEMKDKGLTVVSRDSNGVESKLTLTGYTFQKRQVASMSIS